MQVAKKLEPFTFMTNPEAIIMCWADVPSALSEGYIISFETEGGQTEGIFSHPDYLPVCFSLGELTKEECIQQIVTKNNWNYKNLERTASVVKIQLTTRFHS